MTESFDADRIAGETSCCKIGRAVTRHDLHELDGELPARWRGDDRERAGLRQLADLVNTAILRSTLERADVRPLDGDVEHLYDRLTDESVDRGARAELRRRLETERVDLDAVESQFVSHQTVHTHLTECIGVSHREDDRTAAERRDDERRRLRSLRSRAEAVATDSLERLEQRGDLELPEFDVLVDVTVRCDECGHRRTFSDLLANGGCRCQIGD